MSYYDDPNCPFRYSPDFLRTYKNAKYSYHSEYIAAKDGTKLACSYCLTIGDETNQKRPTLFGMTRYWREHQLRKVFEKIFGRNFTIDFMAKLAVSRGYNYITIDSRGSGASFGSREFPFSQPEMDDGNIIMDWVTSQPWSNGEIFALGVSYVGTTSERMAALNHPALKGTMPLHCFYDTYLENAFPGGCFDVGFIQNWENLCRKLDQNSSTAFREISPLFSLLVKSVKSVLNDTNKSELNSAIQDHEINRYVYELLFDKSFRDDSLPSGIQVDDISLFNYKDRIEKSEIPMYNLCSWYDSGYGDGTIKRFLNYSNPAVYILGDWIHGVGLSANPYHPKRKMPFPAKNLDEARIVLYNNYIDFFDKIRNGGFREEKILHYYTICEEKWKKTKTWPPAGAHMTRYYFSSDNKLSDKIPNDNSGQDNYDVDYSTTTGKRNRWWTLLGLPASYSSKKREKQDKISLVYTSSQLSKDIEITGHPIISILMKTTADDGAIFIYIEDIAPDGKPTYLTEGQFRFIHRKISSDPPIYKHPIPFHTFRKDDVIPVIPGETMEIKFGLLPISALVRKGHQLRVSLVGADKDSFYSYPAQGNPEWTIMRNQNEISYIDIPIIKKE